MKRRHLSTRRLRLFLLAWRLLSKRSTRREISSKYHLRKMISLGKWLSFPYRCNVLILYIVCILCLVLYMSTFLQTRSVSASLYFHFLIIILLAISFNLLCIPRHSIFCTLSQGESWEKIKAVDTHGKTNHAACLPALLPVRVWLYMHHHHPNRNNDCHLYFYESTIF